MSITTLWEEMGQGNTYHCVSTIKLLCESIRVMRTISQKPYFFKSHSKCLIPKNSEIYYGALEALNENINWMNNSAIDSENNNLRFILIYKLLRTISNELEKYKKIK
jgi:hypothetical protein